MLIINDKPERGQFCLTPLFKVKTTLSLPNSACLRTRCCTELGLTAALLEHQVKVVCMRVQWLNRAELISGF